MAKFINVASVQFELGTLMRSSTTKETVFQDTVDTLKSLEGYNLDLVVFSEGVEARGMDIEDAESPDAPGRFLDAYRNFAAREKCFVAGSIKLKEDAKAFNSIVFIDRAGSFIGAYHKSNLTLGELEMGLAPGFGAKVFDTEIGRLGGAVCFDLNFEWLRKEYVALKPDIITFASMYHGGMIQQLWAYECRSFFISALPFLGGGILDPLGGSIKHGDCYSTVAKASINLDRVVVHLDYNREKFPEIEKKYKSKVLIHIPPNLGPAIIYSQSEDFSATDIVNEFKLEPLDDYFTRSLDANSIKRRK